MHCLSVFLHPEVSYAQGMNDLCSRFLEVLDSEVDTFWSFSYYMEKFSKDFRADGLHRKIGGIEREDKCLNEYIVNLCFQDRNSIDNKILFANLKVKIESSS